MNTFTYVLKNEKQSLIKKNPPADNLARGFLKFNFQSPFLFAEDKI